MCKVLFHNIRNCSLRREFAPFGSKFFPLREVQNLKRDVIEENHCLFQLSPFDVRHFFSVLATPLSVVLNLKKKLYNFGASGIKQTTNNNKLTTLEQN